MSALAGVLAEAWSEVRVHRARFVLSLLGVFLAVLAMTTVTALGLMGRQVVQESGERFGGRPATVTAEVYATGSETLDDEEVLTRYADLVERYDVRWHSTVATAEVRVQLPTGVVYVSATSVDPAYDVLHRIRPVDGRWLEAADADRLAPAVVVDEAFMRALGPRDVSRPPTVQMVGERPITLTVVGVVAGGDDFRPRLWTTTGALDGWGDDLQQGYFGSPRLEAWVPAAEAEAVVQAMSTDLASGDGGISASAYRTDSGSELAVLDTVLAYGVRGVGWLALLLGGIGVLNVGVVTVRQRIREIGVRRSFGATSARVFVTVMLESVVATALAGAAAVAVSVAVISNVPFEQLLGPQLSLTDVPPFPVRAAAEGFLAATAVGALAGFVPAVIAVRAKVIDAIRY